MKKGKIIYYTRKVRGSNYSELQETTVTKVGLLCFETALNQKKIPFRITKHNQSWIDGDTSDNHNRYFGSEFDYLEYLEKIQLRNKIKNFLNDGLLTADVYQLRKIVEQI